MYPAGNGVTERSRRFLRFQGSLINHSSFNIRDIDFIEEVPVDFHLLLPMTTGFVRRVNDDLLDILVFRFSDRREKSALCSFTAFRPSSSVVIPVVCIQEKTCAANFTSLTVAVCLPLMLQSERPAFCMAV